MSLRISRRSLVITSLVLALAVPAAVAADSVPADVQRGIESVLRQKASDLLSQKDKDGVNTKRGTYSKSYRKIDDSTYAATFHVDTVEPSPEDAKTYRLRTERYELTMKGFA